MNYRRILCDSTRVYEVKTHLHTVSTRIALAMVRRRKMFAPLEFPTVWNRIFNNQTTNDEIDTEWRKKNTTKLFYFIAKTNSRTVLIWIWIIFFFLFVRINCDARYNFFDTGKFINRIELKNLSTKRRIWSQKASSDYWTWWQIKKKKDSFFL